MTTDFSSTYNLNTAHTQEDNMGLYGFDNTPKQAPRALTAWDGVDSISPADPEAKGIATPKVNPLALHSASDLHTYHTHISKEIDNLLSDKDEDKSFDQHKFEKLHRVMQQYNALMQHVCSTGHNDFIKAMNDETMEIAKRMQQTYNTWGTVIVTAVSAGLYIAGGVAGVAPLTGAFTSAASKLMIGAQQGLTSAAQGFGAIGTLLSNREAGQRVILQVHLDRAKALESEHKDSRRTNQQKAEQTFNLANEADRTRLEMLRNFYNI